jgi:hypothetical protein
MRGCPSRAQDDGGDAFTAGEAGDLPREQVRVVGEGVQIGLGFQQVGQPRAVGERAYGLAAFAECPAPPGPRRPSGTRSEEAVAAADPRPPLGARPHHVPRARAAVPYTCGDTLVLYTDGLVERRNEDIDTSVQRLTVHLERSEEFGAALLGILSA